MVSNVCASSDTISRFHIKAKADFKIHVWLLVVFHTWVWNFKWSFKTIKPKNQSVTKQEQFTLDFLMPLRWDSFLTDYIKRINFNKTLNDGCK